ncbi:hypothetical protein PLESTB_000279500 [Pleodorina starrii]|uniref:Uncharacterized protein n=1 Tax=Pleodorina starrii TaxID=330485 RepID=A0A9W6BDE2_9CHLO|nr:hypothetical protein PLESTM_001409800 [Pleodorina starrii]GLC49720.1 hypothetical protein PLESTB_000279500 [Pleodorina starrii]
MSSSAMRCALRHVCTGCVCAGSGGGGGSISGGVKKGDARTGDKRAAVPRGSRGMLGHVCAGAGKRGGLAHGRGPRRWYLLRAGEAKGAAAAAEAEAGRCM